MPLAHTNSLGIIQPGLTRSCGSKLTTRETWFEVLSTAERETTSTVFCTEIFPEANLVSCTAFKVHDNNAKHGSVPLTAKT